MVNPVDIISALVISALGFTAVPFILGWVSMKHAFLACMLVCIYGAGLVDYYLRIESIYWLCYLLFAFVFARWIVSRTALPAISHLPSILISGFLVLLLSTTIANSASIGQFLVAFKMYAVAWFLLPALAKSLMTDKVLTGIERALLWLPMVQLPFVVHQHFWIAPLRRSGWDAVVGTFGGDPLGGGANGTLMLYMILSIVLALAILERPGPQPRRLAYVSLVTALLVLSLGETKAALFLLPLAVAIFQLKTIARRPGRVLILAGLMALFIPALFSYYSTTYWVTYDTNSIDINNFQEVAGYFFDVNEIHWDRGEVGRGAALGLWWYDVDLGILERAFGNGGAAARAISTVSAGPIGIKYSPLDVAPTAISQLLWDAGVVGAGLFVAALICSTVVNLRYGHTLKDPLWESRMRVAGSIGFVLVCLLVYNRSLIDRPSEQMLLAFLFALPSACKRNAISRAQTSRTLPQLRGSR